MLLELKNLFLEDGGKKDLHYEMDLSQVVFSGVRPFITPVSVTAQAENRAGAIHLKADVAFDFRCPCDRCAAETQRAYRFSFQHVLVNALNDEENDTLLLVENESIWTICCGKIFCWNCPQNSCASRIARACALSAEKT